MNPDDFDDLLALVCQYMPGNMHIFINKAPESTLDFGHL